MNQEIKEVVILISGNQCQRCGVVFSGDDAKLRQIHHRDRNRRNNNLENLELLCFYCHWAEHNFKIEMLEWVLDKGLI